MANATKLPTLSEITFVQLSRPDAPNPRLSAAVSAAATTLKFTYPLLGSNGTVIAEALLLGIRNSDSYVETVYIPAAGLSADGLTATGCVRGINLDGLDWTTGDSDLATSHKAGDAVFCNISGVIGALLVAAQNGSIATGGAGFTIGTEPGAGGETTTIYRTTTAGVKLGFIRWNVSGETEYSDNGTDWTAINDVSASDLLKVSAADTTPGYLGAKLVSATGGIDFNILGAGANETLNLTVDLSEADVVAGTLANICSDVTATMDEINQALDGISANVTDTNLNTCFAGPTSNMDAFHTHNNPSFAGTAGETIDGSVNAIPVALSRGGLDSIIVTGTDGLFAPDPGGFANNWVDFGDADASYKRAQSFTYTNAYASEIRVSKIILAIRKILAPADNLTIEIQGNDTDKPDKVTITDGTSDAVTGASITAAATTLTWATFAFSSKPAITSGTKYWATINRSGVIDAVNYYQVQTTGGNDYASHGNSAYTASAEVWSAENSTDIQMYIELEVDGDNKIYKLDANNLDLLNYVGWTKDDVVADDAINVIYAGEIDTLTGLEEGEPVFASATAGAYTQTPPAADLNAIIPLGTATDTDSLLIEKTAPIIGNDGSNTLGSVSGAIGEVDTGCAKSGTLATFVKTGFYPRPVWINGDIRIDATHKDGIFSMHQESPSSGFGYQDVNNSSQYITAQTTPIRGASAQMYAKPHKNGFYLYNVALDGTTLGWYNTLESWQAKA